MLKKLTAILLSVFIVVLSVPVISSSATDVTSANTFGDITYGYTNDDFLTNVNYDTYYDSVDNGLKYSVNSDVFVNNNDSDYGSRMIETVLGNMSNLNNTEFPDVSGKHIGLYVFWRSSYSVYFYTLVVDGADDLAFVNGYLCSKSSFTIKQYIYSCGSGSFNGTYTRYTGEGFGYDIIDDSANIQYDSTNAIYYRNYGGMCVYSEIPYLFTYENNSEYIDVNYLGQSPYNYQNWYNVYNAYVNNNDTTGFVIDRRTEHMINESSGGGDNPTIDSNLGVIGGSFDCLLSADSLNNQKLLVVYDLNNYTKQIKNTINLKLNYQFFCDGQYENNEFTFDGNFVDSVGYTDSYNVNYSNYVTIDINKVFNNIYGSDLLAGDFGLDTIFQLGNQVNFNQNFYTANEFINSIMKIGGFSLTTRKNIDYYNKRSFWDNVADTVIDYLNYGFTEKSLQFNYNTSKETVFNDCYLLITMYLENEQNNTCSDSYIYKYNYLDGTVSDVGGFADDSVFDGNYPTTNGGSASYPSNNTGFGGSAYGGSAYGGSGGSSVAQTGDIYLYSGMSSIPYLLVDIPEDEWINKTPNLKTILTDFKDALSEVKENSILNVMSETYNYLPVPVWQYFTYGVGILIAIGIWRAITRR